MVFMYQIYLVHGDDGGYGDYVEYDSPYVI